MVHYSQCSPQPFACVTPGGFQLILERAITAITLTGLLVLSTPLDAMGSPQRRLEPVNGFGGLTILEPLKTASDQHTTTTVAKTAGQRVREMGIPTKLPGNKRLKFRLSHTFIDRLAHCETGGDWKNGGNFAGGLGIARSTWIAFGGRQFARTPDRATKKEQIQVANRIALWGFQQKTRFQYPVGLGGWGGLVCALPITYETRKNVVP